MYLTTLKQQSRTQHHHPLPVPPDAIPIARITNILPSLTAQSIQREAETGLTVFLQNLRLDRPRTIIILKRPEAADLKRPRAPAATDSAGGGLESHAIARLYEGPGIVAGVAVCVLADHVGDVEGVEPGPGGAFFDQG